VLCDLISSRSGWQRVAELGGLQRDTDLVVEQSVTGELAFVQIKSATNPAVLRDYLGRFETGPGFDRMSFVCHPPSGDMAVSVTAKPSHIWTGQEIARQAGAAGLFDWLNEKAG